MFWETAAGAAAISGASNLLGGLMGSDDGYSGPDGWQVFKAQRKWRKQDWARQKKLAQRSAGWQLRDMAQAARKEGLHPLAAMGNAGAVNYIPGAQNPVGGDPGQGGSVGDNFLGDAVSESLNTFFRAKQMEHRQEMDKAELELLKAQTKSIEAASRQNDSQTQMTQELTEGIEERDATLANEDGSRVRKILGTLLPAYQGQSDEDAGGSLLGSLETLKTWVKETNIQNKEKRKVINKAAKTERKAVIDALEDILFGKPTSGSKSRRK